MRLLLTKVLYVQALREKGGFRLSNFSYILTAILLGAALSLQPAINATMARILGSPLLAASVSILISLIVVVTLWLVWGKAAGDFSQFNFLPWWVIVGGIVGAIFVAGSIITAPVIGVALFFVCLVAGQLIGSTIIDQIGAFGLEVKPINKVKILGLGLVILGAGLVQNSNS